MSQEAIDPESLDAERDVLAANHPLVRELLDIIVREATRLASTSSNHSADDLLRAAGYYSLGEIPRMQTRRVNAWNLFLREEKANVPEHLRKQKDGASYNNSRPGIDGEYSTYMKKRWVEEPQTREKYQELAKKLATKQAAATGNVRASRDGEGAHEGGGSDHDSDSDGLELLSRKEVQKKVIRNFKKQVSSSTASFASHTDC
jgi:hypothetical protein